MFVKEPKEVVLAYVDAFNRGDLEGLCSLFAPDAQIWGVLGWGNVDKARPVWHDLMEALQINLTVDAMLIEGDSVAVRFTERGKSVRPFRGQPVTNRNYELLAMEWFEVANGLIQRRWGARDSATINRQLGF